MTGKASEFPESLAGAEVSDIDLDAEVFVLQGDRVTDERATQIVQSASRRARARR